MIVATYSTNDLAKLLLCPYRKAYRLAIALNFAKNTINNKNYYNFNSTHPLILSMMVQTKYTKLIYSVAEISKLWLWRKGNYSPERVRQLLKQYKIPIYNQNNKGIIFLCDLQKLLQTD